MSDRIIYSFGGVSCMLVLALAVMLWRM